MQFNLGPCLFNWPAEKWRDFYFQIADEAAVDKVFLGEVVCSKRQPFYVDVMPDVIERLERAGKEVVLSTLALIMTQREIKLVEELVEMADGRRIEANDISACAHLIDQAHTIGPFINIYNEGTLKVFEQQGADHISLPGELARDSIQALCSAATVPLEVQVFGRHPLAISARCYHARSYGLSKDSCQYVCDKHPDGMDLDTLDGDPFLAVNGVQTLSYTCANLLGELEDLSDIGVEAFRLSPHNIDMVKTVEIFRKVYNQQQEVKSGLEALDTLCNGLAFSNGFYYGENGVKAQKSLAEFGL